MRVAIVTESFLPSVNGVTNSVVQVNKQLRAAGHEVRIFAPEVEGLISNIDGTRVHPLPAFNLQKHLPIALPNLVIEGELRSFRPDVVHLASPALMGAQAQKISAKHGIPTVAIYQTDFVGFAEHYRMSFAKRAIQQVIKTTHLNATLNLAPSNFASDQLRSLGVTNLENWGRGVDLERFNPIRRNKDIYGRFAAKKIIGYVGRLAPEKCVERLAVLDKSSEHQLIIIGEGPSRNYLEKVLPNAHFTGKLSGDTLATHIASLDLFVHAGENETFCQAAQEALACGTPVVAPIRGGVKDFVHQGINGIVVDFSQPRNALEAIKSNWSFLESPLTRAQARKSVEGKSWEALTKNLVSHYQTAISDSVRGSREVAS